MRMEVLELIGGIDLALQEIHNFFKLMTRKTWLYLLHEILLMRLDFFFPIKEKWRGVKLYTLQQLYNTQCLLRTHTLVLFLGCIYSVIRRDSILYYLEEV